MLNVSRRNLELNMCFINCQGVIAIVAVSDSAGRAEVGLVLRDKGGVEENTKVDALFVGSIELDGMM